jgi:hypothetical protein
MLRLAGQAAQVRGDDVEDVGREGGAVGDTPTQTIGPFDQRNRPPNARPQQMHSRESAGAAADDDALGGRVGAGRVRADAGRRTVEPSAGHWATKPPSITSDVPVM